ncbi:unnamed protein product [Effrenium voratum]|nr:unnamed protein product [Effrenium voratum]
MADQPSPGSLPQGEIVQPPELTSEAEWPWKKVESSTSAEQPIQPAVVEDAPRSFRKDLWDRFDYLWKHRIEPSQSLLQKVTDLLRSRAELERKYGESLLSFGEISESGALHSAVDAMIVNFRNRGEQSIILADELEQDIIVSFDCVIKQHKEVSKKVYSDVQLLVKNLQDRRKSHDRSARRYGSRCAEAEFAAQDSLQAVSMKTADRLKLAQQATILSKQARVAEYEDYYHAIDKAHRLVPETSRRSRPQKLRLANSEKLAEFQLFGCSSLDIRLLAEDVSKKQELRLLDFQDPRGSAHFVTVDFGDINLGPSMAAELAQALQAEQSLSELRCNISNAHCLAQMGQLSAIELRGNLGEPALEKLAGLLQSSESLKMLRLPSTGISCKGAALLAAGLQQNDFLLELDLHANAIGDQGAAFLAKALEVNPYVLESLDLSDNRLSEAAVPGLQHSFANSFSMAVLRLGEHGSLKKTPSAAVGLEGEPLQPPRDLQRFAVRCHRQGAEILVHDRDPTAELSDMQQDEKELDLVFSVPGLKRHHPVHVALSSRRLKFTAGEVSFDAELLEEIDPLRYDVSCRDPESEFTPRAKRRAQREQANKASALYAEQMAHVLEVLQDMEEKRGQCLRDGLRKLAVYETSWLRNMQYDLEGVAKASEDCDPVQELQNFIETSIKEAGEERPPLVRLGAAPFHQLGKGREPRKMSPELQQLIQVQQHMRQLMDDMTPVLSRLLEGGEVEVAQTEGLCRQLPESRPRAAFCQVLRLAVLKDDPSAELDNAAGRNLTPAAFEALASCFTVALDAADEHNDAWCGRDLMVLAQLFRTVGPEGQAVSLLSKVYNHALWNKVTFWDEVLLLSLCEAYAAEAVWRRSLAPGSQFSKPAMTSFLQRFVGYMMAFGISFEQGRNSVASTLRKNAAFFGHQTVQAYSQLLLEAYEVATPQGASDSRNMSRLEALPTGPALAMSEPPEGQDDFEAVAMGVQADFAQREETPSSALAEDQASDDEDEDDKGEETEALRVLAEAQPKVDDVFT